MFRCFQVELIMVKVMICNFWL